MNLDSILDGALDEFEMEGLGLERFSKGVRVVVHGLTRAAQFNSQQGIVIGPAKDKHERMNGRLVVKLDGGRYLSLKPKNLEIVQSNGIHSSPDEQVPEVHSPGTSSDQTTNPPLTLPTLSGESRERFRQMMQGMSSNGDPEQIQDIVREQFQQMSADISSQMDQITHMHESHPMQFQHVMNQMQQLANPNIIQQVIQQYQQNPAMIEQEMMNNPMFQHFSNSNPQLANVLMNSAQTAWQCPEIVGLLPQLMETTRTQFQQMRDDPEEARKQMKKNMAIFNNLLKPRDPDHFSPNNAGELVQTMRLFVCRKLKWGHGEQIFALVVGFLIDPKKRDSQAQPFNPIKTQPRSLEETFAI